MSTQLAINFVALREKSRAAKEHGIEASRAKNADWIETMLPHVRAYCESHESFPWEHARLTFELLKLPKPSSHHANAALLQAAVRKGWLEWTGRYVQASSAKTHAHPVKVWASTIYRRAA